MSEPGGPEVAVNRASARWSPLWLAAGILFIVSALLAAYTSIPGSLDGGTLAVLRLTVTVTFGLALAAVGVAVAWRPETLSLSKVTIGAVFLLALWLLIGREVLLVSFGTHSAAPMYVDAVVRLVLGGTVVAGVLRSTMPDPWRYVPAVAFAVVVASDLLGFYMLSGAVTDMNAIISTSNALQLVRILAAGAMGAVTLRVARTRPRSVVVFGASS